MNLLDLVVKVGIDDRASGALGEIGSKAAGALGTAAKAGAAAMATASAGVAAVGAQSMASYAQYEQLVGGVNKLFGDASKQLQQYAAEAYETSGMSANEYMEQATSFSAALIQSLGGDTAKAAEQADKAMRAMSDNVNVFGSSIDDVKHAFQGFAKQNYTMLDNLKLGYGGTQAEMERLIDDANEYADSIGEASDLSIDSFSDIVTAIELIQKQQGIAGTTAAEAATTIEGSVNMAKAAWSNWVTELGKDNADMAALADELVESIGTAAQNVVPRLGEIVGTAIGSLPALVADVGPTLGTSLSDAMGVAFGEVRESLPPEWQEVYDWASEHFGELASFAEDVAGEIGGAFDDLDFSALSGVISSLLEFAEDVSPLVADAAGALCDAIAYIVENFDDVAVAVGMAAGAFGGFKAALAITGAISAVKAGLEAFKVAQEATTVSQAALNAVMNANPFVLVATLVAMLATALVTLWMTNDEFRTTVENAWNGLKETAGVVWGAVCDFFTETVPNALSDMLEWFTSLPGKIGDKLGEIIDDVGTWASDMGENITGFFEGIPDMITGALGDLGDLLWNTGGDIIDGLLDGLKAAWDGVTGWFEDITDMIPDIKGPASKDAKLLVGNGKLIIQGLGKGMADAWDDVESQVSGYTSAIEGAAAVSAGGSGGFGARAGGGHSIADAIADALAERGFGDVVLNIDGREFARAVRRAS